MAKEMVSMVYEWPRMKKLQASANSVSRTQKSPPKQTKSGRPAEEDARQVIALGIEVGQLCNVVRYLQCIMLCWRDHFEQFSMQ